MTNDLEANNLSDVISDCIQTGIRNVLGEPVLQAVRTRVSLDNCARKPVEFHDQLVPVFGRWGAVILEKVIVRELFQRLNIPFAERGSFEFERYVEQAMIRAFNDSRAAN